MGSGKVLIVNNDSALTQQLLFICRALRVEAIVCDAASVLDAIANDPPSLITIDASSEFDSCELEIPDQTACSVLRATPIVLLTEPGSGLAVRFPSDMCVYCIGKGPRLFPAWRAVLEELLDITRDPPKRSPRRVFRSNQEHVQDVDVTSEI